MKAVLPAPKTAWAVLAVALVAHVLLLSFAATHRKDNDTGLLRSLLLEGVAPLEKLIDRAVSGVYGLWNSYIELRGIREENAELRAKNNELHRLWVEKREDILEAARLKRALGFAESGIGKPVLSRVIGKDAGTGRQTITLDRGGSFGIQVNTPVITPDGVAGRVIVASKYASIVQTVIDAESAVGVLVGETRQQGIVRGNGSRFLELDFIEDDSEIKEGDLVVTSGLDGVHQKGVPVGTIVSIGPPDDGGQFKKVLIRTAVDFGRLEEVLCVVERPGASPADGASLPPSASGERSQ